MRSSLLAAAATAIVTAQYQPTWESLDTRPNPAWYDQAKFGVFVNWGVYSVPSWGTESGGASGEWFWWQWKGLNDQQYINFVNATQRPGWTYADYASQFTAELWDPTAWATLFKASGAQYVVFDAKHHDGFTLWPSPTSFNWNSVDVGPHRDLVGDMAAAVKAAGLHFGIYHSLFEWFNPLFLADKAANYSTRTFPPKTYGELTDLVNRYQPELLWSDGDWLGGDAYWDAPTWLAWLANESPVKDTVVWNDRWSSEATCHHGSFYTCSDRYDPSSLQNHKWENALTVDQHSWGWRRNALFQDYLPTSYFVHTLVQTVACGGNMLLNIGPAADGTISPIFADRLTGMGTWLGINGEAIYSSTPWRVQNDTGSTVWYTARPDLQGKPLYATVVEWPATGVVNLTAPVVSGGTTVSLLGYAGTVTWVPRAGGSGLTVTLPALTPTQVAAGMQYAWSLKLLNVT